jgi:HK97 family phage prohead protease
MKDCISVPFEAKFSGSEAATGIFSGYGSVFSVIDDGGDLVAPGAFKNSLARLKAAGRSIPMYMQHGPMLGGDPRPVGKWLSVEEDDMGLKVQGQIVGLDTETGKYNYALMKEGAMTGLSIGYRARKVDYGKKPGDPRRTLKEVDLGEISVVDQPMNAASRVTGIKSIEELMSLRDAEDYLKSVGLSGSQAVAFISRIKGIGPGDPVEPEGGPGDPVAELLAALNARAPLLPTR